MTIRSHARQRVGTVSPNSMMNDNIRRICLIAGMLLAFLQSPYCYTEERLQSHRTEDIIYGRKDGLALTMDVFQPVQANQCGIIYLVNGGWLSSKDTPLMQNITPEYYQPFLDRGFTVFAVVTSSQPKYAIPDLISDSQRAVRFVRASAKRWGVRPDRLGVTGSSSGGHLTLAVATMSRPGNLEARDPVDRESSAVQAAGCFFPPTDFLNYGGPGIDGVGQGPLKPLQVAFGPRAETP